MHIGLSGWNGGLLPPTPTPIPTLTPTPHPPPPPPPPLNPTPHPPPPLNPTPHPTPHIPPPAADTTVRFWDLTTFRCVRKCDGHDDAVRVLASSGGRVFSGSYDGTIGVW
jgi:WD40 repeat protein